MLRMPLPGNRGEKFGNSLEDGQVFEGQPSTATPASILAERMDATKTFNITTRLGAIDDALDQLNEFFEYASMALPGHG